MNIALILLIHAFLCINCLSTPVTATNDSTNLTPSNLTRLIPVKNSNNITLAFGSSSSFWNNEPGTIFLKIADLTPDVWMWVGDAVYVDMQHFPSGFCRDHEECIKRAFSIASGISTYAGLKNTTQVIGTWNDRDYGKTDGGKNYKHKTMMQKYWLDFIDEPLESPRRTRNGIYESYYLDDIKKVKIILLDVRFSRDERKPFSFNENNDILGEEQWSWLETELKENQAEFVVIGSGSQILPDDRFSDNWSSKSRDRLVSLIRKYKVGGVVLLSGDILYAEMLKYPCKERLGYELHEFTSSGLTHSVLKRSMIANKFLKVMYPQTWNTENDMYFEKNFGVINFESGENKGIRFQARSEDGRVALEKFIPYSDLTYNETLIDDKSSCVLDKTAYERVLDHYWQFLLNGEAFVYFILFALLGVLAMFGLIGYACLKAIRNGIRSIRRKTPETPEAEKVKTE